MRHVCVSVKFVSPSVVVTRLQASDSKKPPSQEQDIPSAEMAEAQLYQITVQPLTTRGGPSIRSLKIGKRASKSG